MLLDTGWRWIHNGSKMESAWRDDMTTITIKNIPDDLYERIRQMAAANRRSINSQVIIAIEEVVMPKRLDVNAWLTDAQRLRVLTADTPITNVELDELKSSGRP